MCKRLHYSRNVEGTPTVENGHVRMGMRNQLVAIQRGFEIVTSFPEWKNTPIILGESDPEGCAARSTQKHPESAYRNGPMFAAYTAEILNQIDMLASQGHVKFQGALAWSFEFGNQPYFAGFRELPTNGIDKPVLNAFRMLGQLSGRRLAVKSAGAVPADEILKAGVRGHPDVNAIATRREREITILVWNYHDDDVPAIATLVKLSVTGMPPAVKQTIVEHFRIDNNHSNALTEWQRLGSPTNPSADEYRRLEDSGQLQQLTSPQWRKVTGGQIRFEFALPRQALSLLRITW